MSRVGQNQHVQQWQGADLAENTEHRVTLEQSEVLRTRLKTWIDGRTYNKGDLSFKNGQFSAINSHIHFRFLNTDKQSESEIEEVRRAAYDAFRYKFDKPPALQALQEFLFGSTATHEPLTCDELYSLFRLIDDGALENATYEDLSKFMKTAHDVKHSNMEPEDLARVAVKVGGSTFTIGDFIKGYNRHDSVRKTTVNVDSYNEIVRQEKRILKKFQDKIDLHFKQGTACAKANVEEFSLRQDETLNPVDGLCEFLKDLDDKGVPERTVDLKKASSEFVKCADAVLNAPGVKDAPESWGKWIKPIAEARNKCREILEGMREEEEGEMEIDLQPSASSKERELRSLLNGAVRNLVKGSTLLRQELDRDKMAYKGEQDEKAANLTFVLDEDGREEYLAYLTARTKNQDDLSIFAKPYKKGLEFLDSLKVGGRKMSASEKNAKLEARLLQIFQERVDRFPAVRGNPALRSILLDRIERDINKMTNCLLVARMQVSSQGEVNLSQHIEDNYRTFRALLSFFNEDTADMALQDTLDEIVRYTRIDTRAGRAELMMLNTMMKIGRRAGGETENRRQVRQGIRQDLFMEYIRREYGNAAAGMVKPAYIQDLLSHPFGTLVLANVSIGAVITQLRDKGYSSQTIEEAFLRGKLYAASVLFGQEQLLNLALATIRKHKLDAADHVREIDGDEKLLDQMRSGLPDDVKGRIMEVMGLDEDQLGICVDHLLLDPKEAVEDANRFRQDFSAVLKELGLYDVVDKKLLDDILKYAMFAGNGVDRVIAGVVRRVSESGYEDVIRKAVCATQGRISELETRITLCTQFVNQVQNEQAQQHHVNPEEVKSAQGRDVTVLVNWDTKDTGTIFKNTYDALRQADPSSNLQARRGNLLQRVKKYRETMKALKAREKRWLDILTGQDAGLGLKMGENSQYVDANQPGEEPDTITNIWVQSSNGEDDQVNLSQNAVKARLQADLVDLVRKPSDEDGNVDGAQITCVLGREQAKRRDPEPVQAA